MACVCAAAGVCVCVCCQVRGRWLLSPVEGGPRPIKLHVRRTALLEDAFRALSPCGSGIKARLMVRQAHIQHSRRGRGGDKRRQQG